MPSTGCPVAAVDVPASGGALGIGTPSGPSGPGEGAGCSVPSVDRLASFSRGELLLAACGLLPLTASAMPTAAAATTTTAPSPARQSLRRRRCASCAFICAIFSRACCRFLLPLATGACLLVGPRPAGRAFAARARAGLADYLLPTYVDSNMGGRCPRRAAQAALPGGQDAEVACAGSATWKR